MKLQKQKNSNLKESYRWVEAMSEVDHQVSSSTHVIHNQTALSYVN